MQIQLPRIFRRSRGLMSIRSAYRKSLVTFAVAVLAAVHTNVALAQVEQGAITGLVTDQTGAYIPNAKVKVTNTDTQVAASGETNSEGTYSFPFLPHGNYSV